MPDNDTGASASATVVRVANPPGSVNGSSGSQDPPTDTLDGVVVRRP